MKKIQYFLDKIPEEYYCPYCDEYHSISGIRKPLRELNLSQRCLKYPEERIEEKIECFSMYGKSRIDIFIREIENERTTVNKAMRMSIKGIEKEVKVKETSEKTYLEIDLTFSEEAEQDKIGFGFPKDKFQKVMYKIAYILGQII